MFQDSYPRGAFETGGRGRRSRPRQRPLALEPLEVRSLLTTLVLQTYPMNFTTGQSHSQLVASFTDPAGADPIGNYSATITWGDGSGATTGTVLGGVSGFLVYGTHTYAADGTYPVNISVIDADGATGSGVTSAYSAGTATHLVVTSPPPANATLGGTFGLIVSAEDNSGFVDRAYVGNATVALVTPPAGLTLGGTTTQSFFSGTAPFSGLTLNQLGYGDTLQVSSGSLTATTATLGVTQAPGDYIGVGKTQPAVARRVDSSTIDWFIKGDPSLTNGGHPYGAGSLDVPVTGDFDGDGKTDLVVYRPSTANWYAQLSGANYVGKLLVNFGGPNIDLPVPGNYNGTGTTVVSVYRPSTGQWFINEGGNGHNLVPATFPTGGVPVPGDYDNIGKDEPAVYNPATSQWLVAAPNATTTHVVASFGGQNDIPVPGSYDATATDHAVEAAVWRPTTGQFFIQTPTGGTRVDQFAAGDIPMPGDYDGIGVTEAAVYRPSTSQWYVMGPTDTTPRLFATYGGPSDIPTGSPLKYREIAGSGLGSAIHVASIGTPGGSDFGAAARGLSLPGATAKAAGVPATVFVARTLPAQGLVKKS